VADVVGLGGAAIGLSGKGRRLSASLSVGYTVEFATEHVYEVQ
jgi:hypothetical protein